MSVRGLWSESKRWVATSHASTAGRTTLLMTKWSSLLSEPPLKKVAGALASPRMGPVASKTEAARQRSIRS